MSKRGGRQGGRASRQALRAAPLADDLRPVRAGFEGGQYKVLDEAGIKRIHEAALDLLETLGMARAIPSCVEYCTSVGAIYGEDERLRFPRAVVEDALAKAGRHFPIYAQDPKHDLDPTGKKVHFGTAGAAVHVVDVATRTYRESTLKDLYDAARIVDVMDNIHFFQRPMVARDMEDPADLDINTLYASIKGTSKHVGTSFTTRENTREGLKLLHMAAGSEEKWRARPFVSISCCFVVPPLNFAEDACDCMEEAVLGGMPVLLLAAGQAGATSPAPLAGAVVLEVAEVLAALVYVNAIKPGHPAIFAPWPFVADLRTGAMSGGSGEQALMMAACAQMGQFYDLPVGSAAGMADSKLPDIQSGAEKGLTTGLAGVSGANMIYESAGMHASLLGFSLESLIIDNDTLGSALRCVRGIEVTDATLAVDATKDVVLNGPGHYLGHEQTLSLMQTEYVYPALGDRTSPKEWVEMDRPDIVENAVARKEEILSAPSSGYISAEIDAEIRKSFKIYLD